MSWPVPPHGFLGSQASTAATDNDTYQIGKSLRFNSADSAYLNRTLTTPTNNKKWSYSFWVKRTTLKTDGTSDHFVLSTSSDSIDITQGNGQVRFYHSGNTYLYSPFYRDYSSWGHYVFVYDSDNATQGDRFIVYFNGSRVSGVTPSIGITSSAPTTLNTAIQHNIGVVVGGSRYFDGYLAEVNFIDGQALTPSSFGETDATTGRWKAKAFSGTYGTNGFYLNFSNNSSTQSLGWDQKGNITRYIASGTYSYTVPAYSSSLVVEVWGGGGGGGQALLPGTDATNGGQSSFNGTVIANGGNRGVGASSGVGANGTGGTASGGDTNTTGNTGNSTAGASSSTPSPNSGNLAIAGVVGAGGYNGVTGFPVGSGGGGAYWLGGSVPTAGAGGSGGYSKKTYAPGAISGTITVVVGAGGAAGVGNALPGGAGTDGMVRITVDGATTPSDWYQRNLSVDSGVGNDSLTDSPSNYGAISTTLVNDTYQISKSLRFNSADSANLTRTLPSSGNLTTWTWSGWVKPTKMSAQEGLFYSGDGNTFGNSINFNPSNQLEMYYYSGGYVWRYLTTQAFRDPTAWYHVVGVYDSSNSTQADRVRLYVNGVRITSFSVSTAVSTISQVGSVNNSSFTHYVGSEGAGNFFNGYLADVNFIDGQALTPTSFGTRDINTYLWKPKAYTGTYGTNGFYLNFSDSSNTTAATLGKDQAGSNNWTPSGTPGFSVSAGPGNDSLVDSPTYYGTDTGVGGEARGNYCTLNPKSTTAGTFSNGNLRFVGPSNPWARANGTINVSSGKWYYEVTLGNAPYSPRNSNSGWNAFGFGLASVLNSTTGGNGVSDAVALTDSGYYTNFNGFGTDGGTVFSSGDVLSIAVDLDANTFTFRRNNTQIATGTIGGTAGRLLTPCIISYDGQYGVMDVNFGQRPFIHAAPSGFRALRDYNKLPTPTGGEVRGNYATHNPIDNSGGATLSNGNLDVAISGLKSTRSTIAMRSGKWYCECLVNTVGNTMVGLLNSSASLSQHIGSNANSWGYYHNGQKYLNNSATNYGNTYTNADIIGIAYNADSGKLWFSKNGTWQASGDPAAETNEAFSSISGDIYFSGSNSGSASSNSLSFNFGQRPWAYDAPFGFLPLCTTLLPQPIVQKPSSYMDVVTWTGNANSSRSITGFGFSPDLIWIKGRSGTPDHALIDTVRGTGAKVLSSNQTDAENDFGLTVTSFDSGGFTVGSGSLNFSYANTNSATYVAWAWDESPIAGVDIVTASLSGTSPVTVNHLLGVAPKMIIGKIRSNTSNWYVNHSGLTNNVNYYATLNSTAAQGSSSNIWDGAPTSTSFVVGNPQNGWNGGTVGSANYVFYLFAEVEGFSKFGSYTGNGSADGPFVYCGFRPRYIMYKRTDAAGNWNIIDTARDTYNPEQTLLRANLGIGDESNAVYTQDFLANGWKIRSTNVDINVSTATYIFAAFAEAPFKYSRAR